MAGEKGDQGRRQDVKRPAKQKAEEGIKKKPAVDAGVSSPVNPRVRDAEVASSEVGFAGDIFEYLRRLEMEPHRRPLPDYMENVQHDINPRMREILMDLHVQVVEECNLSSDTLYLSISYIDRYLSLKAIPRQKLGLLGVSAMLVSLNMYARYGKYEEINTKRAVLGVEKLCSMTGNTYTTDQVIDMESDLLKALEFNLGNPTMRTFLRRFNEVALEGNQTFDLQVEFLGYYLAELSMLNYSCVPYLPSLVAASVVFLERFIARPSIHPWCSSLEKYTGYRASKLKGCVEIIHKLFLSRGGRSLEAVREKCKRRTFNFVASIPAPEEILSNFFEDAED